MQDKAALRLDRPPDMNRTIRRSTGIDADLIKQPVQRDFRHDPAHANTQRTIYIMRAHGDNRLFETRIADARHRKQILSAERGWRFHGSEL
jgi:hypothetical protein